MIFLKTYNFEKFTEAGAEQVLEARCSVKVYFLEVNLEYLRLPLFVAAVQRADFASAFEFDCQRYSFETKIRHRL